MRLCCIRFNNQIKNIDIFLLYLLQIVLPRACLYNSRYLSHDTFCDMLSNLGFQLISSHNSPKLSFRMFRRTKEEPSMAKLQRVESGKRREEETRLDLSGKRKVLKKGVKCNNFSIVIR